MPVYLIFLSAEKDEQLDIISFFMYIVHAKRYKDSKLIGIAASKAHAFELVRKLADKVYKSEHNLDFKSYFNKK